jgi:hypothetical protein
MLTFTIKILKKSTTLLLGFLLFISCKPMYQTIDFNVNTAPPTPDYSLDKNWAVLPHQVPSPLQDFMDESNTKNADVFFIYPTLFTDKKNSSWNADYTNENIRNEVVEKSAALQASAWCKAANLYMPFYRQAHYRIFIEPYATQGHAAGLLAYQDVKRAFEYYLRHFNNRKPIIIASHSQGSLHAKKLIQEFFDNKPLQSKLIAAYLVGVKIKNSMFKKIKELKTPDATGGFVSWNTYKKNKLPKRYEQWYKGGVTTNPITWNKEKQSDEAQHLGVLNSDKKIYPQSLSVNVIDGMLWSSVPKIPNRFLLSFVKNYHFADINLFWADIEQNAVLRTKTWFKQNSL